MKLWGCCFRKECKLFQEKGFTCNSFFSEDQEFCGEYRSKVKEFE